MLCQSCKIFGASMRLINCLITEKGGAICDLLLLSKHVGHGGSSVFPVTAGCAENIDVLLPVKCRPAI